MYPLQLLWLLFAWCICFQHFTLNLFLSLNLKCISYRENVVKSCLTLVWRITQWLNESVWVPASWCAGQQKWWRPARDDTGFLCEQDSECADVSASDLGEVVQGPWPSDSCGFSGVQLAFASPHLCNTLTQAVTLRSLASHYLDNFQCPKIIHRNSNDLVEVYFQAVSLQSWWIIFVTGIINC